MKCKQTIIVAAPLGSGTSRVTMLLKQQGVFMGSHPNTSHEDLDFALPFFNKSMLQAIAERNEMYEIWGWKFPFMRNWFGEVFPYLVNPCFIYCNRSHRERCLSKPEKYDFPAIKEDYMEETNYWKGFFAQHPEVPLLVVDFNMKDEEVNKLLIPFLTNQNTLNENFAHNHNNYPHFNKLCRDNSYC